MTFKLSPSTLSLLDECPRCFWLGHVKGIRRPDTIFPSLPNGVDRILKKHFDGYREKGELPPELEKENIGAKLFPDLKLLNEWRSRYKGLAYTDPESGTLLKGLVDDMLQNGDKLIVLDFKTRGYPLKEDSHTYYQDQLDIYNLLLRKNGYETEDYAYLLYYYPEKINGNGDFVFETALVKMDTDVGHAEGLFLNAISTLNGTMPNSSAECGFCQWVLQYASPEVSRKSFKDKKLGDFEKGER